jgi:hypothetical protein
MDARWLLKLLLCVAAILVTRFPVFVLSEDVGVDVVFILLVGGYWMESKCNFAGLRGIDGMACSRILYVLCFCIVHCSLFCLFCSGFV